jgi:hypothetical protein
MRDFSNKKPKEIKEFYNQFIDSIPQRIKLLKDLIKKESFSYSFEEIKSVEDFYVKTLKNVSKLNISKETLEDVIATYFGIASKSHLGGKWEVELDKKVDTYGEVYLDYYDYEFKTGWFIYPYSYTWFLESNQYKIGEVSESINHLYDLQLKDEEKIKGYKIKPIKEIN